MGVTRETLYAEVWAEPMTTVAKRYDELLLNLATVNGIQSRSRAPSGHRAQGCC